MSARKVADRSTRPSAPRSLVGYYGADHTFRLTMDGVPLVTSIAARPDWLNLGCSLAGGRDRASLAADVSSSPIGDLAARAAVGRLANAANGDVRIRNAPIYRLLGVEFGGGMISADFSVVPLADYRADARIGSTLRRELEEELFGRTDVDSTIGTPTVASPMHPTRLSEPMRWLTEDETRMRLECTAFGLNLVSGNYEFASLVMIDDEEFWPRFGGHVEANWEASGLRQYSTLDRRMLAELIADESWSDEGLFALTQGLRRLREIDPARVDLPSGL